MSERTECCPHCGDTHGYIRRYQLRGVQETWFDIDGAENSTSLQITSKRGGKIAYCYQCGKAIDELRGEER